MVKSRGNNKPRGPKDPPAFMHKGNMPPQRGGPFSDEYQGNMPPWMRGPFPDEMWEPGGNVPPWMGDRFPDEMWGPEGDMPPWMRGPGQDEMCERGGPMPPWRRGPFPPEWCERGGPMPPEMRGPFPGERCRGPMPPEGRGPFPDEMCEHRGPMPPDRRGPFPDEMRERRGPMPPDRRGRFPDEMCERRGPLPPDRRGPFPDEMCERRGPMPPDRRGPFPDEMCERRGPMPPDRRGPFPDEMRERRGPMPPDRRGPFPDEMRERRGPIPPDRRGPFPDGMHEHRGPMPPDRRGPFPDEMCERRGPMPPERRGPFPDEMCDRRGPMPPDRRGPFPDEMCERRGPMPPEMRGPFPDEMCEGRGPMPREMRGPFPDEMCDHRGPMPPEMRGPFPDEMCEGRGPMPPDRRGPFPSEMCERRGPMPPEMRGPFPNEMCEGRGPMPPQMQGPFPGEMCERRGPVPPQMRGPFPNDMCNRKRNLPPQMGGTNSHDPRLCGPLPKAGEDGLRRPSPSPAVRQKEVEKCGPVHWKNDAVPSGNHSSDQSVSGKVAGGTKSVQDHYIQEGTARILESFGLSNEDLEELSSYPEDQLKPENMPEILREIRTRKMAHLTSKGTVGGSGLCSSSAAPGESMQPTTPLVSSSVSQPTMSPVSSESWRMANCPTPSMMSDYYGASPRLFPHTCILCKVESKHARGWLLHLSSTTHLESCRQLHQQYPDWNPEDPSFRKRYESDRNANLARRQQSVSSSPGRSSSSRGRHLSRSRSRSPVHHRGISPTELKTSKQSAAQGVATEHPLIKSEHPEKLPKDLGQQEQPKEEAASQEPPKTDPQQLALSSLVEKSVSQAMSSLLQSGGVAGRPLAQAANFPALPPLQLDPTAISLGLVSMMQMVATQVVQSVLASKETLSGQASSAVASASPQPGGSASSNIEKQENKQGVVSGTISPQAGVSKQGEPKRVLIIGHGIIVQASQRAESSDIGSQLGLGSLAKIEWLGQPDMSWDQLLPTLTSYLESSPPPDILVVHLGDSDLGLYPTRLSLSLKIRMDLAQIREKVPRISIIWSHSLERRVALPNMPDLKCIYRMCKKINRDVRKVVVENGGASIPHSNIKYSSLDLYQEDGVHLSDAGYDLFLKNLQQGLMEFIRGKGREGEGSPRRHVPSGDQVCSDPCG